MEDNKPRILYIDDEIINLQLFQATFRRDFNITTTLSPIDALEILENESFHVIITDQKMPKMTGIEFLKVVQERFPTVPPHRMIVSGYSENEVVQDAYETCQLHKFISKPWNAKELKDLIEKAIQGA